MSVGEALRPPQFVVLVLTSFFCCATHSGPIFHTVSYTQTCGIPLVATVSIYSVEGLAGKGGRLGFGLLGDRFGAKRVLVLSLLRRPSARSPMLSSTTSGRSMRPQRPSALSTPASCRSYARSCARELYAVLARKNFPRSDRGLVFP
jgi:hypothetical protein